MIEGGEDTAGCSCESADETADPRTPRPAYRDAAACDNAEPDNERPF